MSGSRLDTVRRVAVLRTTAARAAVGAAAVRSDIARRHLDARTAELAGLGDFEVEPLLKEWDYGAYEGITTKEISAEIGRPWEVFADGVRPGFTPGETVEEVAARASRVLARVDGTLRERDVALFAHGHYLRILAATYLRQDARFGAHLLLDAGSVCVLEHERGEPAIRSWNEVPAR